MMKKYNSHTGIRSMTWLGSLFVLVLFGMGQIACDSSNGDPGGNGGPDGSGDTPAPDDYGVICTDGDVCGDATACYFYDDDVDDKICSFACDTSQDCPSDVFSSCKDVSRNGSVKRICVPHNLSPMYGEICDAKDSSACDDSSSCFTYRKGTEDAFCSFECTSDADCPNSVPSSCISLDSDVGLVNVCVPNDLCIDPDGDEYGSGPGCLGLDCDQKNKNIHPGADEICDGIDNNCNGEIDDNVVDENRPCETGLAGLCADGEYKCTAGNMECQARVLPGERQEICDGIDNDCDGLVDEGSALLDLKPDGTIPEDFDPNVPPEYDPDAMVDQNGNYIVGIGRPCGSPESECFSGYQYCDAASLSLRCSDPQQDKQDTPDLCDGVDNNCNGQIDEDTHLFDPDNTLGKICQAGQGTCRGVGRYVCDDDPAAKPVCNATARPENKQPETCDYTDEDCDDVVDNGFVDDNGVYARIDNCGRCHNDCRVGWGEETCTDKDLQSFGEEDGNGNIVQRAVSATCASTGTEVACVATASSAQCEHTCMDGFYDLDRVPSNGCEFKPDAAAVYVATPEPKENPLVSPGADTSSCGSFETPCATITYAIGRAQSDNKTKVFVSEGIYEEAVTVVNGISVIGGYSSRNWLHDPQANATTIRGGMAIGDKHVTTVLIDGINQATEFSGFTIEGQNAGPLGNTYGIYVRGSNASLTIKGNTIIAGRGGVGTPGANGGSGNPGGDGEDGKQRVNWRTSCSSSSTLLLGGTGGESCESNGATAGGVGAATTVCPNNTNNRAINSSTDTALQNAPGSGGGVGGNSGSHTTRYNDGEIIDGIYGCTSGTTSSSPGTNGSKGTDAAGGAAAGSNSGRIDNGIWIGDIGGMGANGTSGRGGGGGGSSGGIRQPRGSNFYYHYGPTGGGGGAGGCGGNGGAGGHAGGGSFGIFVVTQSGGAPVLSGNVIKVGQGGRGGTGGAGGAGGAAGEGGEGGQLILEPRPNATDPDNMEWTRCGQHAQRGGAGGRGGHGGGGGGGAGGVAIGIATSGSDSPNYSTGNTIDVSTGAGGAGGAGGSAIINAGAQGPAGLRTDVRNF